MSLHVEGEGSVGVHRRESELCSVRGGRAGGGDVGRWDRDEVTVCVAPRHPGQQARRGLRPKARSPCPIQVASRHSQAAV